MEEVKKPQDYKITIPSGIRNKLNIKISDRVPVYINKDRIIMKNRRDILKKHRLNQIKIWIMSM